MYIVEKEGKYMCFADGFVTWGSKEDACWLQDEQTIHEVCERKGVEGYTIVKI